MTITLACPEDKDNPLSYEYLDGEWRHCYQVAHRFEHKVPAQDRGNIRHTIILELAKARVRDGEPIPTPRAYRIASLMVALYWRKEKSKPTILSLDHQIENGDGDSTELIETVADDRAIDIEAWLDARTWLLGCPMRLVQIAYKKLAGEPPQRSVKSINESDINNKEDLTHSTGILLYKADRVNISHVLNFNSLKECGYQMKVFEIR